MVSPGLGKRSEKVVRSTLALPTTAMIGRLGMFCSRSSRVGSGDKNADSGRVRIVARRISVKLAHLLPFSQSGVVRSTPGTGNDTHPISGWAGRALVARGF